MRRVSDRYPRDASHEEDSAAATAANGQRSVLLGTSLPRAVTDLRGTTAVADVLREASRHANEAIDMSFSDTHELQRQGEQLEVIDHTLDEIHYELKLSDRVVRGMSSWSGAIKNWFSSKPKPPTSHPRAVCRESNARTDTLAVPRQGHHQTQKDQRQSKQQLFSSRQTRSHEGETDSVSKVEDALLDSLLNDVSTLRDQALIQGDLLTAQNKRLDEITAKNDNVKTHIEQTNRKVRKMI